jgi:Cellulase (glycosyl hydrolase family 5)
MRLQGRIRRGLPLALAVAALAPAQPAHARKHMEVALADNPVFLYRVFYDRSRAFKQTRPLAVTRLRVMLPWSSALGPKQAKRKKAPAVPVYYLKKWDSVIDAAASHGIRVELRLSGPAPAFATSNHKIGPTRPRTKLFGEFAAAIAAHFKGRVDRYGIWNEPNYRTWLSPMKKAPQIYRGLYQAGYKAIKQADPAAAVLIGETAPYAIPGDSTAPLSFLRKMAAAGKGTLHADGFAHHPYDFTHAPSYRYPGADNVTIGTLGRLTKTLDRLRHSKKLVAPKNHHMTVELTEFGYFVTGRRKIPESRAAKYLREGFAIAQRNRRVTQLLQYVFVRPPKHYRTAFFDTGILNRKGSPRKPYRSLAAWVKGASKHGGIATPGGPIALPPAPPSGDTPGQQPPAETPLLPPLPFP